MVNSQPKLAKSIIDQILYLLFWYAIVYIGRFVDQYADDRRAIGYQYAVLLPDKQTKLSRSTHCLKLVDSWPGYPSRLSTSFRLRRSVGRMVANAVIDISIVITMNTPHKIVTRCGCLTYTHRKRALIKPISSVTEERVSFWMPNWFKCNISAMERNVLGLSLGQMMTFVVQESRLTPK